MSAAEESSARVWDVARLRSDFPALETPMRGKPLVYLDSASSAQKPRAVIEAIEHAYADHYANVHRGIYEFSQRMTDEYEAVREKVAHFIGAADPREIVFTRNLTEGVNLVAQSYLRPRLEPGDEILISAMEHHANIVPWQLLCDQTGALLRVAPIDDDGEILVDELEKLLSERTRLLAFVHVSNVLGTINPVEEISALARARGVPVLVDGAQAAPHLSIDVQSLGCDFYGFTAHKLFGPTGVGVLWAKLSHLEQMPPYQGGGDMIESVSFEKSTFAPPPHKFEAGTPNIAGVIGLGAAIDYVSALGVERIASWEHALLAQATLLLESIPGLEIIGSASHKAAVISFVMEGVHAHDIGTVLDGEGVAVRAGHHCAQPLMDRFGVPATTRASFSIYNTPDEVETLAAALFKVQEIFG